MPDETVSAITTIMAPAETVFAVLTDPATHAAIDGTGWVCETLDGDHLTGAGQIFRMAISLGISMANFGSLPMASTSRMRFEWMLVKSTCTWWKPRAVALVVCM